MISKIICFLVLSLVSADQDPTKVCSPDQVSFYSYNIEKDVISLVNIDYKSKIMAVALGNTTVVNDLQSEKSYITENGTCQSSDLPKDPYPQCLPANAVQLANITVGLGSNQLTGTVWQFPYNNGVLKVAFTNVPNAPNYPFLTRFVDDKGVVSASFFVDIATNITQPALLKIPDLCPPKVIV